MSILCSKKAFIDNVSRGADKNWCGLGDFLEGRKLFGGVLGIKFWPDLKKVSVMTCFHYCHARCLAIGLRLTSVHDLQL